MRYNKKQIEQKRLRRLKRELGGRYYPNGVILKGDTYYRVYGLENGVLSFMKRLNNKRIRHYDGELNDGSHYKRIFEHWGSIY